MAAPADLYVNRMSNWVLDFVQAAGYPGIALLMFLETVFPPIPSEIIMPLAGYLAARGQFSLWGITLAGTAGSVLGASALYAVGRAVPLSTLEAWAARHGRWLTVSREDIGRAEKWFKRRGGWAVFLGRLVPGIRSLISIPAGLGKMGLVPFLMWTTAGSALWTAILAGTGYVLGSRFRAIDKVLDPLAWVAFGVLAAWYLVRILRHPGTRAGRRSKS
ncbi:MAG: alkaline phosphatase [Fibrobacteria bacterium]|jgi:membrane protein DedA with SNARE-associated domain|nr:alkaline phosphatase [Fibrobacteria bacterium]